jgi:hypothetical protein
METVAADFVKVLVDVLIWQVATNEHAVDQAICTRKFGKSASSFPLSKVVE